MRDDHKVIAADAMDLQQAVNALNGGDVDPLVHLISYESRWFAKRGRWERRRHTPF